MHPLSNSGCAATRFGTEYRAAVPLHHRIPHQSRFFTNEYPFGLMLVSATCDCDTGSQAVAVKIGSTILFSINCTRPS
jgi:hypothetical protein